MVGTESDGRAVTMVGVTVVAAGAAALVGTYWDDAWHTDRGRDAFAAPPHLVLYAGVAVMLAAVGAWAWIRYRGSGSVRAAVRESALLLPLVGAGLTLLAAPIDEGWHRAFGRDAVLWSPPHTLGIVGLLAVGAGLLLAQRHLTDARGQWVRAATAALVFGAALVPVMEYETDVPQFALFWYLPVLTAGVAFALAAIQRAVPDRWAATRAAGIYTVVRIGVLLFLVALGGSTAIVPPILAPTIVDDLGVRRGWSTPLRAVATSATTAIAYTLSHQLSPQGLDITLSDAAPGAVLGTAIAWGIYRSFRTSPTPRASQVAGTILLVLVTFAILPARSAWAHDPGQGPEVGGIAIEVSSDGARTRVDATVNESELCANLKPVRLTARRAGDELHAELSRVTACSFEGRIELPDDGTWFVYTEFRRDQQPLEAWIPFDPAPPGSQSKDT